MAQVAFPEPMKGEANPNVVIGTVAGDQVATDVTGVAMGQQRKLQGTCKRRCCWTTSIVLSFLTTMGIGILVGFFIFRHGNEDREELGAPHEKEYAPEMGGFFTLSVANATRFLAHPQVKSALSSGIASLHSEVSATDVIIKELLQEEGLAKDLDDLGRRLQGAPEAQHIHVLYTVRRDSVEEAKAVLEVLQLVPAETVTSKLQAAAVSFGVDPIDAVAEPQFCMVLQHIRDRRGKNLRGGGRDGRERPRGGRGDRRLQSQEDEEDEEDEDGEEGEEDEEEDEEDDERMDCDWAERLGGEDRGGRRHRRDRENGAKDKRDHDEDDDDDDD